VTRRLAPAALAGAAVLAIAGAAFAAVPKESTYKGKTAQGQNVSVKVNAKHRVKRFRIAWWAPCEEGEGATWGTGNDPDGTVDRDTESDPIEQTSDGSFSDTEKYKGDTDDDGFRGHFKMELEGKFSDKTHAHGKFTIRVRVTKDGTTYDHCDKTIKWHVGD
jgi:hypothetical protein